MNARSLGRYTLLERIASGGMGAVHFGCIHGDAGYQRAVAIKCMHPELVPEPHYFDKFAAECKLIGRVRHPSVVPSLDLVREGAELFMVMEYVHGDSLSGVVDALSRCKEPMPIAIAVCIVGDVLAGLQAAHELADETGRPLGIVHRDMSPANVMVGADGLSRVIDFGIATTRDRREPTRRGFVRGKLGYLAPELFVNQPATLQSDIYAVGVMLWELLASRRCFEQLSGDRLVKAILRGGGEPPSAHRGGVPPALDDVVLRSMARDPRARFETARAMRDALRVAAAAATREQVGDWLRRIAASTLAKRAAVLASIESDGPGEWSHERAEEADPATLVRAKLPVPAGDATPLTLTAVPAPAASKPIAPSKVPSRRRWLAPFAIVLVGAASWLAWPRRDALQVLEARRAMELAAPVPPAAAPASTPAASVSASPLPLRTTTMSPRCDPPYSTDGDGVRHVKPHCLPYLRGQR